MEKVFSEIEQMLIELNSRDKVFNIDNTKNTKYYNYLTMCLCQLILDKKLFKRNRELLDFLEKVYNFTYPNYVKKSRMMILGKSIQYVSKIDNMEDIKIYLNKSYSYLMHLLREGEIESDLDWETVIETMKF